MIYTKEEWAAELEVRKEWDWTLSDMELSRRHPYVLRESIQRLRHQLGHPTVRKTKKPKVYSDESHLTGLKLQSVDDSERLSNFGPKAQGWRKRFWKNVDSGKPDECWIWKGGTLNIGGYGMMMIGTLGKTRRFYLVHRLAFVIEYGEIPSRRLIRHKCDVKLCVNPAHLELGTNYDNIMDAVRRQGLNCGEKNGMSKTNRQRRNYD